MWALTILAVIAVGVLVQPSGYLVFLPVVLGLALVLAFALQLIEPVRTGLVNRLAATFGGVLLILLVSTAVMAPLAFASGAAL
ncbi:hypothetical protein GCM10009851_26940 [Herbiconiux moechotypicola]|uniref:AI-2E family transporter n=1 Tax=Herbiconiux moechotypicola TaxID=637393 RepID=A0ABN3DRZ1_9MICO